MVSSKKLSVLALILFSVLFSLATSDVCMASEKNQQTSNLMNLRLIKNMDDLGIYSFNHLVAINRKLYISCPDNNTIVALNEKGEILAKAGKQGEGPGEFGFMSGIVPYRDGVAVYDSDLSKIVFYTDMLEYRGEKKTERYFAVEGMVGNKYIFSNFKADINLYFTVCDSAFKEIKRFEPWHHKNKFPKGVLVYDFPRALLTIDANRFLAVFNLGYDVYLFDRYVSKKVVQEKDGYFKYTIDEVYGRKKISMQDVSLALVSCNKKIFYFYRKDKKLFIDTFDKDFNFLGRQQIILPMETKTILAHMRDNLIYMLRRDEDSDSLLLYSFNL